MERTPCSRIYLPVDRLQLRVPNRGCAKTCDWITFLFFTKLYWNLESVIHAIGKAKLNNAKQENTITKTTRNLGQWAVR